MPPRLRNALLGLVLLAVVAFGISRISFKVDILKTLPGDLDEVRGLELYLRHFSRPDELIVAFRGSDPAIVEDCAKTFAGALRDRPDLAADVIDHAPWEDDPAGLSEFVAFALLNRPPAELEAFEKSLAPGASRERLEEALDEITFAVSPETALLRSYDPLGLVGAALGEGGAAEMMMSSGSEFVSGDGTFRVVYVRAAGERDRARYRDLVAWIGEMRAFADAIVPPGDGVAVSFTGEPAFVAEISSGMERDMKVSGLATLLIVGAVFWLWYRRLRPLATLVAMLILTFLITLGIAGLVIRDITVMTVGFASILIGLSVDYGVLVYQATLRRPGDPGAVRRHSRRGILCAGATTAVAFGSLAVSSLPGLSELGILVAIGIAVGAAVMLTLFAGRIAAISRRWPPAGDDEAVSVAERRVFSPAVVATLPWLVITLIAAAAVTLLVAGPPPLDATSRTLRPRVSEAYDTLDEITARLVGEESIGSLLVRGSDPADLRARLAALAPVLEEAKSRGDIERFMLPTPFVPDPANQSANLARAAPQLMASGPRLSRELREAGFAEDAARLLGGVLDTWQSWSGREPPVLPESRAAHWILDRLLAIPSSGEPLLAAGHLVAAPGADIRRVAAHDDDVFIADWNQAMLSVLEKIPAEVLRILLFLVVLVLAMLVFTFRRAPEVIGVILSITLSLTALLGVMRLLDWSWNFLNLATLLLTFGAGLDYSIHMLLGFQRTCGDVARVQRDVGQALLVCALSTVAGFGSLSWASNVALASLGRMCALGLFLNALVAIFLLPRLWLWFGPRR